MIKTIMIEDQPLEINSSLGWLFCYREQFGHDILPDLLPLLEAAVNAINDVYGDEADIMDKLDEDVISKIIVSLSSLEVLTVCNILWAMAKNAGEKKTPQEWLNSFDVFPLDTITPQLFWAIVYSSASSKNLQSLINKIPMEKIPSAFRPSSWQEQAED